MALGDAYCSIAELKQHSQIADTLDDTELTRVVDAVSRQIERLTGRQFNDAGSASARVFWPSSVRCVEVDDFSALTSVESDTGNDGNYSTTITDYTLYPLDGTRHGVTGWPYNQINLHSSMFPTGTYRPPAQITAQWGWAAVPADVKQAALIQSARIFARRYSVHGVVGAGDFAFRVSSRLDPDVEDLLRHYMRHVEAA